MRVLFKRSQQGQLIGKWFQRQISRINNCPHVAIIGSGPAGFYTAQHLLKGHAGLRVDIYEKLPVPFGLVRFGVAPDHPEVKNCINSFTQTAHNERCQFFGNVEVGRDIKVSELLQAYSAVVLCHGASMDRCLNIPGENLKNVVSARAFVGWYNGLPEHQHLQLDLNCEKVIILGHGNVALDVARILLSPHELLLKTDICEQAMASLSKSKIKHVHVVGRRGPLQVAFTIKEFREMITLPGCRTVIQPTDVAHIADVIGELPRPRRRLIELLHQTGSSPADKYVKMWSDASKEWHLHFKRSPVEIKGEERVQGINFVVNRLQGSEHDKQTAIPTDETDFMSCGLVLRSIGYQGIPIDSNIPFDSKHGVIPNENGRVIGYKGLYCSGWISKGPVFVLLGTMNDAFATADTVLDDLSRGSLISDNKNGQAIQSLLQSRGVKFVDFAGWEKIDRMEQELGKRKDKPREKLTSVEAMLNIALF